MGESIGQFEQAVLIALIRLDKDAYGRAILTEIQSRLERNITAGAVYATLERLEGKGFVTSKLAPGTAIRGGMPRRYFTLTGAGLSALNDARTATETLWRGISLPRKARA